jgi:outer membrane protein assembly factor BamB
VLGADPAGANISDLATDGDIVAAVYARGDRPQSGGVVALDAHTGAVRWLTNFSPAADSNAGGISVALWEQSVLASSNDGRIYMFDRTTGATLSYFSGVGQEAPGLPGAVGPDIRRIAVSGATLFAGSLGSWFIAHDLVHRRELWRLADPEGSPNNAPIVVDGDKVYVIHFNGRLAAFSASQPKFLWDVGDFQNAFVGSPVVGPDKIFVAGLTGFWAIDK